MGIVGKERNAVKELQMMESHDWFLWRRQQYNGKWKITRPLRYDLNQTPYYYTMEKSII